MSPVRLALFEARECALEQCVDAVAVGAWAHAHMFAMRVWSLTERLERLPA